MPVFYSLPAHLLVEGLSTDDGQDVLSVSENNGSHYVNVYTPRRDDRSADEHNRSGPELRVYDTDQRVHLAVFDDTVVDLSRHPAAADRVER